MSRPLPILCLMGPTAIGKTDLAIALAQRVPCHLISVDSVMVYRGMDIGTGKPSLAQLRETPHALIDCCDPADVYSAGRFCDDAAAEIAHAHAAGKWPILVGGTMLYYRALLYGLAALPQADAVLRDAMTQEAITLGWPALHLRLAEIDPLAAARIHPHDAQRIQRALEVWMVSGRTLTDWIQDAPPNPYQIASVALCPEDRAVLYARIADRFDRMVAAGFVAEVEGLYRRGDLTPILPSVRAVGYQQVWAYLAGKMDWETCREQAIMATRHLAKRQLTWLRPWPAVLKISDQDPAPLETLLTYGHQLFR